MICRDRNRRKMANIPKGRTMTPTHEINQYITEIDKIYRSGKGTEHSYRPALKCLVEAITSGLAITNEPKHIDCGAPD
jgi:hypothetical protein